MLGTALEEIGKVSEDIKDLCSDSIVQRLSDVSRQVKQATDQVYIGENSVLEKMIMELTGQLKNFEKTREVYSEIKILNFDKYANPDNPKERRVTSFELMYHPKMQYPYAFTISNGWGIPVITKNGGVIVGEGTARYEQKVNILLDDKNLMPMLKRVELFLQMMLNHGLGPYFESVMNPPLYGERYETEDTARF